MCFYQIKFQEEQEFRGGEKGGNEETTTNTTSNTLQERNPNF